MKLKRAVPIVLCVFMLAGCAQKGAEQPAIDSEKETSPIETDTASVLSSQVDEPLDASMDKEVADEQDESLYESFLHNKAKVKISNSNNFGYYFNFEENVGSEYTLEEIVNLIIANYVGDPGYGVRIRLESIEYTYIDCGRDGTEELLLKVYTPSSDDWTEYIIIKEVSGSLETIYSDVAWARSSIYINEYGYIYGDGSGGASHHVFDKAFIDAYGTYHYIYSDYSDGFGIGPEYIDGHPEGEPSEIDGQYVWLSFDFDNTPEDENYNAFSYAKIEENSEYEWEEGFKGYFYCALVDDDSVYEEDHPLRQYIKQTFHNGDMTNVYSLKEIDKMIADREQQEGLTDEVKNGKAPEWETLNYDFEPVIASYNDDNILGIKEFFPLGFILCNDDNTCNVYLTLEANGEFSANYSIFNFSQSDSEPNTSYKNEGIGEFKLVGKENDHAFKLELLNFTLVNLPDTTTTYESRVGSKTITYYTEIPGLDDSDKEYIVYAPGTTETELGESIMSALPEYAKESQFDNGVLNTYLLYEIDGNHNVWRNSGY